MKFKFLAFALFPLVFAACQSGDIQKAGNVPVSVLQQKNAALTLSAYLWSTPTGTAPKPLVLHFDAQGRLGIATSCNGMGTTWKIENNQMMTGDLISTQMACDEASMQQEKVATDLFNKRAAPFILDLKNPEQPSLSIVSATGQKYIFTGKMTAETQYQTQAETIFLEISPEIQACKGITPQTCLHVREIKYAENGLKIQVDKDWTLFYEQIQGYQHNPAEQQVVRIKRYEIKNPAADQSKYAYVHDMTIERAVVE